MRLDEYSEPLKFNLTLYVPSTLFWRIFNQSSVRWSFLVLLVARKTKFVLVLFWASLIACGLFGILARAAFSAAK